MSNTASVDPPADAVDLWKALEQLSEPLDEKMLAQNVLPYLAGACAVHELECWARRSVIGGYEKLPSDALLHFKIVDVMRNVLEGPDGVRLYAPMFRKTTSEPLDVATKEADEVSGFVRREKIVREFLRPYMQRSPKVPPRTKKQFRDEITAKIKKMGLGVMRENAFNAAWRAEAKSQAPCEWLDLGVGAKRKTPNLNPRLLPKKSGVSK